MFSTVPPDRGPDSPADPRRRLLLEPGAGLLSGGLPVRLPLLRPLLPVTAGFLISVPCWEQPGSRRWTVRCARSSPPWRSCRRALFW
ncbi:hypothetical protein [Kitasatospora aureofaciens]|uniref:hypothetical protein n=1 Tax=Kitasatospora aureofaciens TaxID=1894 RepID=UPI0037C92A01